jgi:hypothetical protein
MIERVTNSELCTRQLHMQLMYIPWPLVLVGTFWE